MPRLFKPVFDPEMSHLFHHFLSSKDNSLVNKFRDAIAIEVAALKRTVRAYLTPFVLADPHLCILSNDTLQAFFKILSAR